MTCEPLTAIRRDECRSAEPGLVLPAQCSGGSSLRFGASGPPAPEPPVVGFFRRHYVARTRLCVIVLSRRTAPDHSTRSPSRVRSVESDLSQDSGVSPLGCGVP